MPKLDLGLPSYEDTIFSTEEQRQEARLEKVTKLSLAEIEDFKDHPFHVEMDEDMFKLIESVKENGVLIPVLVRPKENGYEMISGHRRKFALDYLGIKEVDAIIRDLDDDQATILMVDTNIQRENILPTERGYAYKMRLDAMVHQGKRAGEYSKDEIKTKYNTTSRQVGEKSWGITELANQVNDSERQIQRFIRLTYLIKPLQEMVDGKNENELQIAFNPAVELSFLTEGEQRGLFEVIDDLQATPSLAQAQELKRRSQRRVLSKDYMMDLLECEKPNQKEKISLAGSEINQYFPKNYTPKQKKELIIKLLGNWAKRIERNQER